MSFYAYSFSFFFKKLFLNERQLYFFGISLKNKYLLFIPIYINYINLFYETFYISEYSLYSSSIKFYFN
ncbi:hypothetical protein MmiEs2_16180 [Methanimicrococcus stummii]|uniref:Uncharacterized protein n=1 Tax=Methanimicrococcus stummii TaxID=3028294 RepID=A0AA96ZYY8_9EURY|nr:hypothetical protein MmiEs2_16180 [Methanimicrococcus sp. Es2]